MSQVNSNLPQKNPQGKGASRHTLSSGAYFYAQFKAHHTASKISSDYTAQRNLQRATPAQSRRIRNAKPVTVSVHSDMLKVRLNDYDAGKQDRRTDFSGGGIRGTVAGFSRASRKRMIEFMASVRNGGDMYFVTMTYDDWSWLRKSSAHQDDLEAFRHRFQRAFPNFKAIWRVEVKERLSGELKGNRVPHFHLLIFTGRHDDDETKEAYAEGLHAWGTGAWGEIIEAENPKFADYGFHVSQVRSRKQAYSYVSKYIGKMDFDDIECGRRWGRIGRFDCSISETIRLDQTEYVIFRRLVKRWLRNRNAGFARKFARGSAGAGCCLLGLGDTNDDGSTVDIFGGFNQFIVEARRQRHEQLERERSRND